jgi:hypothetical protein
MKTKKYLGILSLAMGLTLTACSDDDYDISTTPLLTESSIVTGSSDVTATSATLHGTIKGLEGQASSAYKVGFEYGFSADNLSESVLGSLDEDEFSATLSGLTNNSVLYYRAYVCLQNKVYYRGEVKSLITTDAKANTKAATSIDFASAVLGGTLSEYPSDATCGVVISTSSDVEAVRAGLVVPAADLASDYTQTRAGLLPNTHYYYAAYLNLGTGIIYGDVKDFTTPSHEFDADEDFVDLGLSVKWAKANIGAKTSTELGGLFGFGDSNGCKNSIDPADYASTSTYNTENDLAYIYTGHKGTLPSADDFEELFSLCTSEWTTQDGVGGYKLTGPNGNSIFLPAAGARTANEVAGEGTQGNYLTGTINPSNNQFAVSYLFTSGTHAKTSTPVYQALSVRPVSTARNVKFDKTKLYTTWYLENYQDGKLHAFNGPFTQLRASDTWNTVTNNEPSPYKSIHWELGSGDGWIGYTWGVDYGSMTFNEDGTVLIIRKDDDGNATEEKGTFTVDEANKTITIDINVLCANTWLGTKSGTLNILSLDGDGLQIALPADDTYSYSLNYYSKEKRDADQALAVQLTCVGSDWGGTWNSIVDNIAPANLLGSHTFTYEGSCNGAMVFLIDFLEMNTRFPDYAVTITDIRCDGQSIPFDGNKLFFGDIEDKGNFRVEFFNIWGKGSTKYDGSDVYVYSPFSTATNVGSDPAFQFSSKLEIDYTIFDLNTVYYPTMFTINPSWGGPWSYSEGANFQVKLEDNKYVASPNKFTFNFKGTDDAGNLVDFSAGTIMTSVEIGGLYGVFPGTHSTLDELKLDGTAVTGWDASKVLDTNNGSTYRLELWNMYAATSVSGCAFGNADENGVIKELGFSSTMDLNFTIQSLFTNPF